MRKSFPKILIAFFLTVFILQIICLFFLLAAPVASQAIEFKPQVGIPGAESGFQPGGTYKFDPKDGSTAPIAKYIRAVYNYAIGIIGILAAVVLMVGGVLWIIAGGNTTQIGEAKAWIGAALTGLLLALTSYLILSTVNPALVNLQITKIPGVKEAPSTTANISGCCLYGYIAQTTWIRGNYYSQCTAARGLSQADCVAKDPDNPTKPSYTPYSECKPSINIGQSCSMITGSCWIGATCENNITEEKCISKGGIPAGERDCSKPSEGRGSCTTIAEQSCIENTTEQDCFELYAVFKKDERCPVCCVSYTWSPVARRHCEYLLESDCKNRRSSSFVRGGKCNADLKCVSQ